MSARSQRLHRLLEVRRVLEDIERCNLQTAHAAVAEVEAAQARQQFAMEAAGAAAASALHQGHRDEWLFAEAQSEVSAGNRVRLAPLLQARRAEVEPATAVYLDRRTERRQVQQLIAEARQQQQLDEERKARASSDDFSLSRHLRSRR